MWHRSRRLLVPVFALSLAAGGLAFAATDPPEGVDVSETAVDETSKLEDATDVEDVVELDDDAVEEAETTDEAEPTEDHRAGEGPERSTEGCPEGFSGNHGRFVSGTEDRPRNEAARSPCGKPVKPTPERSEDDDVDESLDEDEGAREGHHKGRNDHGRPQGHDEESD